MKKQELPIASDGEVSRIVDQFEKCSLPYKNWTHRAHLAVAVFYSRNRAYQDALSRIRQCINIYNSACGDPDGYNETITIMFMRKIFSELNQGNNCASCFGEVERISKLCSADWLFEYYTPKVIFSASAKAKWVAPDVKPLDF